MTQLAKTHYPDTIFVGRPCCRAEGSLLTRELRKVTCKRCLRIVQECEQAEAQRAAEVAP